MSPFVAMDHGDSGTVARVPGLLWQRGIEICAVKTTRILSRIATKLVVLLPVKERTSQTALFAILLALAHAIFVRPTRTSRLVILVVGCHGTARSVQTTGRTVST